MARHDAVHRTVLVVDIAESSHPFRRDGDRIVMRNAMYGSLSAAFGKSDWLKCYHEDRGDGVLVLVPPEVPKARLVTGLPDRLEAALARHNRAMQRRDAARAAAMQIRLRVALHAGEVTFDQHGVVGTAIDHTFRLADALPLKAALAASPVACALIVSDWFYTDVVYHHQDARPDSYRHIGCEVKGTQLSAWMRVPGPPPLALVETA
jgi:hypothetical protein